MSIVSSYALKDKKYISVNIYSIDAAVILHDFLIKAASKGMEEGKFFEAEMALHDANELAAAMEEAFEEESNG
jgi:hypothetical protein|nr:MAG TPA: hypothetical protein [Caudoviricetes sp.]